jgi:uncharacterized membrane protein
MSDQNLKAWSVTLTPHRSLSGPAFKVLFSIVLILNFAIALLFYKLHAWPVFGFLGLDIALFWFAFKANDSAAECSERIIISGDDVRLVKAARAANPIEIQFNRRWLRIVLEYDTARELVGRLLLVSRGTSTEIASFLGADERKSLAHELRQALASPKI